MVEEYSAINTGVLTGIDSKMKGAGGVAKAGTGQEFKTLLMESINEVNQLQAEADQSQINFATGKTESVEEVFTAVRKAEIAYDLLVQIQNKLLAAYDEIKQMRV